MKICTKCKEIKSFEHFSNNSKYKDGKSYKYKSCEVISNKKWNDINKDIISNYNKVWNENNIQSISEYNKLWYSNNKEWKREYDLSNKQNNLNRLKKKYHEDPLFRLKEVIRSNIYESLTNKGYKKNTKTEQILGCTYIEFKLYLESKFHSWMDWSNQGNPKDGIYELNKTWDIDHIIPLNSANTEEEILKLNHFSNLQPLCSYTNRFVKRYSLNWK